MKRDDLSPLLVYNLLAESVLWTGYLIVDFSQL